MNIDRDIKSITNIINTKFLRTVTYNTLCYKTHTDRIIPKLNAAGSEITVVKPPVSQDTWKMVYYAYFHSIMITQ